MLITLEIIEESRHPNCAIDRAAAEASAASRGYSYPIEHLELLDLSLALEPDKEADRRIAWVVCFALGRRPTRDYLFDPRKLLAELRALPDL